MKRIVLIGITAVLMVGCSNNSNTPKDDPNDPFIKPTREFAVRELGEHFKTAIADPMEIKITQCDYSLTSPVRLNVAVSNLLKNEADFANGIINKKQYKSNKIEWLEKYECVMESWTYGNLDSTVRDYNDKHRLYYCVAPYEKWDADGKNIDTAKFYIRWGSYDPRDTTGMNLVSSMDVFNLYYDLMIQHARLFDESLNYRHYNDRGPIYNRGLNKWYRTQEELEEDLKKLGY